MLHAAASRPQAGAPRPYVLADELIKEIAPRDAAYLAHVAGKLLLLRVIGYRRERSGPRRNQLAAVVADSNHSRFGHGWIVGIDPVTGEFVPSAEVLVGRSAGLKAT